MLKELRSLLYEDIIRRKKFTPFIIFIFFLLSFTLSRFIVWVFPNLNFFIKHYHIHHFYYGMALLFISNWIALVSNNKKMHHLAAGITGVGLGLIIDEVGLLLTCSSPTLECDYWARQTYDIVVWLGGAFFAIIYIGPVWRFLKRRFKNFITITYFLKRVFKK